MSNLVDERKGLLTPATAASPVLDVERLGVGRFGARWWTAVSLLAAGTGFGLYAYSQQLMYGEGVTGMRTIGAGGATWGLYIAFVIFFIGVSFAGITVSSLIRIFDLEALRPLARAAELLTLVSLAMGAICVMADLGQPLHGLLALPKYARPTSPFFGDFTLVVGGTMSACLVYFFLGGRADAAAIAGRGGRFAFLHRLWGLGYRGTPAEAARHRRVSFGLAVVILPLLVAGESTLGFIFGIQGGRPGWFNALQAPGFVVMAGVSGTGVLILVAAALRKFLRLEDVIQPRAFRWLGNLLLVLSAVYLYFMVAEELTANYAAQASETRIAHEVVAGAYAPVFWTAAGSLLLAFGILFSQFLRKDASIAPTVAAGLLVNVAAVAKRFLIVVPSQTHGTLLPFEPGTYEPTWVEYGVIAGLFSLGALLYLVFLKVFPIVPVAPATAPGPVEAEPAARRALRLSAFLATLLTGLGMAVVGFLVSARVGTQPTMDPVFPYAPVLFIAGIVLSFASAAVYELVPAAPKAAA